MGSRLDFIENGDKRPGKAGKPDQSGEITNYPVLARYDFAGNGPRAGIKRDEWLYEKAGQLKTKGELLSPTVRRIAWLLLRIAIGFAFAAIILNGSTFGCGGSQYIFN